MVDATPTPPPEILSLALAQLVPSPTNPRQHFDEGKLDELAASMQTVGVLSPLVVRPAKPSPHLTGGTFYEIVAGERRFRAAKRAKLQHVPVVVRELTDLQVLETQLIENAQRDDIHAIDNAEAFARLQKLDGSYNAKVIAAKIGKSERYVQNVLHYAVLVPTVKEAFRANQINAGHADLIARLKPADQERALKACFHNLYGEDKERGSISVRDLNRWIDDNIRVDPVADAPSFPELQQSVAKSDNPEKALATILQVSGSYGQTPATKGLLTPNDYKVVTKKDICGHMRRALIVIGEDRGKLVDICTAKTECKVHFKYVVEEHERQQKAKQRPTDKARPAKSAVTRAAEKRAADKLRLQEERRVRMGKVWNVVRKMASKALPNKPTPALFELFRFASHAQSWRDLAVKELHMIGSYQLEANAAKIGKILKPLGIDLVAIERELFPPAKGVTDPKDLKSVRKQIDRQAKFANPRRRKAGKKR